MKIIWTDFAIENLKIIFEYYAEKANKKVAHKIRKQILYSTRQLIQNPKSGQIELYLEKLNDQYRYILIIYKVNGNYIVISDIFDTRQNPIKMIDDQRNKK
ncbi:toxin ParE1/3/4 [Chryseobacterium sp. SLBN-27]|uniref:type II toxin-antitoxin system RelE/ParE family toxin n=1 Tax=Chryseobacterium sp. SLBN-27 TaxID=3042287 RepID=UPI002866841A|nr:type II toxin-antitoxin system RelE/ParE family toxin [Chryseobacterium sp. SLBN-27]MDR6157024.1 toxin ParE1/3/4 [Chryseobacterium sp. SLBN-27]